MAKEIEIEADGLEFTMKPINLSLNKDKLESDEIPNEEDAKLTKALSMKVYRVTLYCEAIAETVVKGETKYDAIEKAKDSIPPSGYKITDLVHNESKYIEDVYVKPDKPEKAWEYKEYIMDEYGYEYFDLMNWQLALLQSDDQTTLKRFGVGDKGGINE